MRPELMDLALWQRVTGDENRELLDAARRTDPKDPAALARLRKRWDAPLVVIALELTTARQRAAMKFPDPHRLVADVQGVEQATSLRVAQHKARRFAEAVVQPGAPEIVDLCCGIGGDTMALANVAQVTAVDANPVRAWMAQTNAACRAEVADVLQYPLSGQLFHLDPDRRAARDRKTEKRTWRYAQYQPGPAYIERLLADCPHGAVKLGPGVDFDALPLTPRTEIELVNDAGTLVQTVLWCGNLAHHPGLRTATRLPEGLSFSDQPGIPLATGQPDRLQHLLVADPAIERAQLLGALCRELPVWEIHPGLGLLGAEEHVSSPWLTGYEIIARMPWRLGKIRQWLRTHGGGIVEVKTRGRAVETDAAQRELRGDGDVVFTVFGLRLGRRVVALIGRKSAR